MIALIHTRRSGWDIPATHVRPGMGRGTITVRSTTAESGLRRGRSLIHHGFNRIIFVNGHGSNVKVIDPILRKLRYDTGALISFVKPYMENYVGILSGLMENPLEETPGWHSSELETSQDLAWNDDYVRMERANFTKAHIPEFLPKTFAKKDGMPDVEFEGFKYFTFPMDHHEFIESGVINQPAARHQGKGEEASAACLSMSRVRRADEGPGGSPCACLHRPRFLKFF
jgi:creatinine amidohydrolase